MIINNEIFKFNVIKKNKSNIRENVTSYVDRSNINLEEKLFNIIDTDSLIKSYMIKEERDRIKMNQFKLLLGFMSLLTTEEIESNIFLKSAFDYFEIGKKYSKIITDMMINHIHDKELTDEFKTRDDIEFKIEKKRSRYVS